MPFNATDLYFPSFKALHDRLDTIKLENGSENVSPLESILPEYTPWLIKGLRGFKPPSDTSKSVIETETSLVAAGKELPIETALTGAAVSTVSKALVRLLCCLTRSGDAIKTAEPSRPVTRAVELLYCFL